MFCPKCGQEILGNATFCAYCGEPVTAQPPVQQQPAVPTEPVVAVQPAESNVVNYQAPQYTEPSFQNNMPAPKKANGKLFALIGAGVAVVAAIILIFVLIFSGPDHSSAETIAIDYITAQADGDAGTLLDCMPDFAVDALCKQSGVEDEGALEEQMQITLDAKLAEIDSIEIGEAKITKKYDKEDILEIFEDSPYKKSDYKDTLQAGAYVEVKVTVIDRDGDKDTDTVRILCAQIDSDWYVVKS